VFGHSKDYRADLPQVVIAVTVTRDGIAVRCWTFVGNSGDTSIIRTIKDDVEGWNLRRLVWWSTAGSPPGPTAATSPRAAATTSTPRSCGPRTVRPPLRWLARVATRAWPVTYASWK